MTLTLFSMSCQEKKTVFLTGVRTETSYGLTPFDSIRVSGVFEVVLTSGAEEHITIRTDTALLPYLHVRVEDKELRIDMDKIRIKNRKETYPKEEAITEIAVTYRSIKRLVYRGVGILRTGDTLRAPSWKLVHKAVGELRVDAVIDRDIDVTYEGVGAMILRGRAQQMYLKASGVGKIDAGAFRVANGVVKASGVGKITLFVTDTLWLEAKGLGGISFTQKPKILRSYSDYHYR